MDSYTPLNELCTVVLLLVINFEITFRLFLLEIFCFESIKQQI